MGAWGLDSSENDSTFDAAGFGIMERCGGVELSDTGKEAIAEDILKEDPKALDPTSEYALSTGPVVLLLKMGAKVPPAKISAVLEHYTQALATDDHPEWSCFSGRDAAERRAIVEDEMVFCRAALENNGRIPGTAPGCGGIDAAFAGKGYLPGWVKKHTGSSKYMELTGAMFSTNSQVENMILKQVEKLMEKEMEDDKE